MQKVERKEVLYNQTFFYKLVHYLCGHMVYYKRKQAQINNSYVYINCCSYPGFEIEGSHHKSINETGVGCKDAHMRLVWQFVIDHIHPMETAREGNET